MGISSGIIARSPSVVVGIVKVSKSSSSSSKFQGVDSSSTDL